MTTGYSKRRKRQGEEARAMHKEGRVLPHAVEEAGWHATRAGMAEIEASLQEEARRKRQRIRLEAGAPDLAADERQPFFRVTLIAPRWRERVEYALRDTWYTLTGQRGAYITNGEGWEVIAEHPDAPADERQPSFSIVTRSIASPVFLLAVATCWLRNLGSKGDRPAMDEATTRRILRLAGFRPKSGL